MVIGKLLLSISMVQIIFKAKTVHAGSVNLITFTCAQTLLITNCPRYLTKVTKRKIVGEILTIVYTP